MDSLTGPGSKTISVDENGDMPESSLWNPFEFIFILDLGQSWTRATTWSSWMRNASEHHLADVILFALHPAASSLKALGRSLLKQVGQHIASITDIEEFQDRKASKKLSFGRIDQVTRYSLYWEIQEAVRSKKDCRGLYLLNIK